MSSTDVTQGALDREAIAAADPNDQLTDVLALPEHLRDALWKVESAELHVGLPRRPGRRRHGRERDRRHARPGRARRPRLAADPPARAYGLPPWTTPDTTVLCASYSGDTEETLACLRGRGRARRPRVVVTTRRRAGRAGPRRQRPGDPGRRRPAAPRPRSATSSSPRSRSPRLRRRPAPDLRDRRGCRAPRGARHRVGPRGPRGLRAQGARAGAAGHRPGDRRRRPDRRRWRSAGRRSSTPARRPPGPPSCRTSTTPSSPAGRPPSGSGASRPSSSTTPTRTRASQARDRADPELIAPHAAGTHVVVLARHHGGRARALARARRGPRRALPRGAHGGRPGERERHRPPEGRAGLTRRTAGLRPGRAPPILRGAGGFREHAPPPRASPPRSSTRALLFPAAAGGATVSRTAAWSWSSRRAGETNVVTVSSTARGDVRDTGVRPVAAGGCPPARRRGDGRCPAGRRGSAWTSGTGTTASTRAGSALRPRSRLGGQSATARATTRSRLPGAGQARRRPGRRRALRRRGQRRAAPGPGADNQVGGADFDSLSYAARTAPVTVVAGTAG